MTFGCDIQSTLNADTSIKRTPVQDRHNVLVPALRNVFPCPRTLCKTDPSLKRTADTFWKNFGPIYL